MNPVESTVMNPERLHLANRVKRKASQDASKPIRGPESSIVSTRSFPVGGSHFPFFVGSPMCSSSEWKAWFNTLDISFGSDATVTSIVGSTHTGDHLVLVPKPKKDGQPYQPGSVGSVQLFGLPTEDTYNVILKTSRNWDKLFYSDNSIYAPRPDVRDKCQSAPLVYTKVLSRKYMIMEVADTDGFDYARDLALRISEIRKLSKHRTALVKPLNDASQNLPEKTIGTELYIFLNDILGLFQKLLSLGLCYPDFKLENIAVKYCDGAYVYKLLDVESTILFDLPETYQPERDIKPVALEPYNGTSTFIPFKEAMNSVLFLTWYHVLMTIQTVLRFTIETGYPTQFRVLNTDPGSYDNTRKGQRTPLIDLIPNTGAIYNHFFVKSNEEARTILADTEGDSVLRKLFKVLSIAFNNYYKVATTPSGNRVFQPMYQKTGYSEIYRDQNDSKHMIQEHMYRTFENMKRAWHLPKKAH